MKFSEQKIPVEVNLEDKFVKLNILKKFQLKLLLFERVFDE